MAEIDTRSKRKRKSDERAQELCREVRFQLSKFGCLNSAAITPLLEKWMNVTDQNKYRLPKHRQNTDTNQVPRRLLPHDQ